jgi:hypothetical protein
LLHLILTQNLLVTVVIVPLVANAVIGAIRVVCKIGSGSDTFVLGIMKLPSVGAMVIIISISNFVTAQNVIVVYIILLVLFLLVFLVVVLTVLIFLVIYVCVTEETRESQRKNRPILSFDEKLNLICFYQLSLFSNRLGRVKQLLRCCDCK